MKEELVRERWRRRENDKTREWKEKYTYDDGLSATSSFNPWLEAIESGQRKFKYRAIEVETEAKN